MKNNFYQNLPFSLLMLHCEKFNFQVLEIIITVIFKVLLTQIMYNITLELLSNDICIQLVSTTYCNLPTINQMHTLTGQFNYIYLSLLLLVTSPVCIIFKFLVRT